MGKAEARVGVVELRVGVPLDVNAEVTGGSTGKYYQGRETFGMAEVNEEMVEIIFIGKRNRN